MLYKLIPFALIYDYTMKQVIVYDLNKTLYKKSSKDEFFKFICYKRGYKIIHLFQLTWFKILGKTRLIGKTSFKENFYNYLNNLSPEKVKKYAQEFWSIEFPQYFREEMIENIVKWNKNGAKVYIITGGFEIYTKHLEKLLPVTLLGTKTRYINGKYVVTGKACNDEEKIKRLQEEEKEYHLVEAYSDDKEDILYHATKGYYLTDDGALELV